MRSFHIEDDIVGLEHIRAIFVPLFDIRVLLFTSVKIINHFRYKPRFFATSPIDYFLHDRLSFLTQAGCFGYLVLLDHSLSKFVLFVDILYCFVDKHFWFDR